MSTFIERPRTTCALGGALATISALPRVVPIIHTALGCGGNLSGATAFGSGYCGSSYSSGQSAPSSGITETEIVFGGSQRLQEEIESALELIDADLFVTVTGCMTEIIGDDVQGVISEFTDAKVPVIAVSTPSFKGDAYAGYEIVLNGIFNRISKLKKDSGGPLVNLLGVVPNFDPFFRGDLYELKRVLEKIGLSVNTFFTPDQSFENIRRAPNADLNIVLSRVWGIGTARFLEQKYETPYWVTDLPIGPEATDRFLRLLTEKLDLSKAVTERVIEEENNEYYRYFERAVDVFTESEYKFYTATVTNSNYAIPITSFVQNELGWVPKKVFVTDVLNPEQKEAFEQAYAQTEISAEAVFETDTIKIAKQIGSYSLQKREGRYQNDFKPFFILGSSLEKALALKSGTGWLGISYPVYTRLIIDRGYAGYRGGLHLIEDIVDTLVAVK